MPQRFDNGVLGKVSVNFDFVMPYRFPVRIFGDRGSVFDDRLWSHKFAGQQDWIQLPVLGPESSDVTNHPFQAISSSVWNAGWSRTATSTTPSSRTKSPLPRWIVIAPDRQ